MKLILRLVVALGLVALPLFAAQKDDDFAAAQKMAASGKIEDAARLFCSVAKADPAYRNGEAAQDCKIYQDQVNRENARNEERYTDGINFFNQGQFDNAESKFKAIKSGPHLAEAQDYLGNRIPGARKQAVAQGAEAAMNAKFDAGVQAFNNNAFSSAQGSFQAVTAGSHQAEAQSYLQKISQYQQLMQQGDSAVQSKNYPAAASAYQQAAGIKSDGPGDPGGKLSSVRMMASTTGTVTPPVPAPAKPVTPVIQAKKVDIPKLLREAQLAEKKKDFGVAKGDYLAILADDPSNAAAKAGLDALPKDTGATGAEVDVLLVKGIGEFYNGNYSTAEVRFTDYISNKGGKSGLAYFYLATSKITRYFLSGASDKRLYADAQEDFKKAKASKGFAPPDKMVSPKIMKAYQDAG